MISSTACHARAEDAFTVPFAATTHRGRRLASYVDVIHLSGEERARARRDCSEARSAEIKAAWRAPLRRREGA
eukprot:3188175-Pleurochrysis_carterae.AAC.2